MSQGKTHYENLLKENFLPAIKEAEAKYQQLEQKRKVYSFCVELNLASTYCLL